MRLKKTGQTPGKKLNVSQKRSNCNYIGMLERGERNPAYFTLLAVANGLELELYDLLIGGVMGKKKYTTIELFVSCGEPSLGLYQAG